MTTPVFDNNVTSELEKVLKGFVISVSCSSWERKTLALPMGSCIGKGDTRNYNGVIIIIIMACRAINIVSVL